MARLCTWCRRPLPEGARKDKDYCSDACRARARRKSAAQVSVGAELPAAARAPSLEEQILSCLYDARTQASLRPLQVDELLSLRARQVALEQAAEELHRRSQQMPAQRYGTAWSAAAVVAEEHAATVAVKARALAEPEATHLGVAQVPIGGGKIVVAVVVAAPPGARVLSAGEGHR